MIHKFRVRFVTQLPDFSRFIHRVAPRIRALLPLFLTALAALWFALLADWQSPVWRYQREAVLQGEIWWLLAGSLAAMAAGFLVLEPQLVWSVGLSGVLHGLILGGAVLDIGFGCRARVVLIGIVLAKLAWEQVYGALPFTAEAAGGPVVVAAHLYGGLGGLLAGGLRYWQAGRAARV